MKAMIAYIGGILERSILMFTWSDALEILIFTMILYYLILWIKKSRAWTLLKGIILIASVYLIASILSLNELLYVFRNIATYVVIGSIIILQPEIRKALEQLGSRIFLSRLFSLGDSGNKDEKLMTAYMESIVKASFSLGKTRTGALIVIEKKSPLDEFVSTGIALNADISVQLLIQIFEHNTPLHDGAIIIRGGKILAATCYLPLSANMNISKDLGTRHRAGLGISEISDSMTVIVSEETGHVSVALNGELYGDLDTDHLRAMLTEGKAEPAGTAEIFLKKGRQKGAKKN